MRKIKLSVLIVFIMIGTTSLVSFNESPKIPDQIKDLSLEDLLGSGTKLK